MTEQRSTIDILGKSNLPGRWAVKDSFNKLDLSRAGFDVLLEASWIRSEMPATDASTDIEWRRESDGKGLPIDDPDFALFTGRRGFRVVAGGMLYRSDGVVGLSNVVAEAADAIAVWRSLILLSAQTFPRLPLVGYESPAQVLAEVRAQPTTIGVVPAPIEADSAPWWPLLAGRDPTLPNVVARLPFLVMPNARARGITALVLARIEPEDSGDDRALISLESAQGFSRDRLSAALAKVGLPAFTSAMDKVVAGVHHYLLELPGVIADSDPRLHALEQALALTRGTVATIGAYAVPARS